MIAAARCEQANYRMALLAAAAIAIAIAAAALLVLFRTRIVFQVLSYPM